MRDVRSRHDLDIREVADEQLLFAKLHTRVSVWQRAQEVVLGARAIGGAMVMRSKLRPGRRCLLMFRVETCGEGYSRSGKGVAR